MPATLQARAGCTGLMLPRRCVNGIKRLPNGKDREDGYRAIKVEYVLQVSHSRLADVMSAFGSAR
jgi:hypothetical protein